MGGLTGDAGLDWLGYQYLACMMKIEQIFSVKGKVALVTGGSRGIGQMIASAYLANGVRVYIAARKADAVDAMAAELSAKYQAECISIPADLSQLSGIDTLVKEIEKQEGQLDILVNNAGAAWGAPLAQYPEQGWDKVMDLNVKGLFYVTQKLLPLLTQGATADSPARVINIGSVDGILTPGFENYAYSAAKAAVHHLTRVLAARLVAQHILVNAIAPGAFPSRMLGAAVSYNYEPLARRSPIGRIGTPEDIGGLAIYLASRAGCYTVGQTIVCDGGAVARAGHDLTAEE